MSNVDWGKLVAQRMKGLREQKEMTQEQVAEAIGMTFQGYGQIERGRNGLNVKRLGEIAEAFKVSPAYFFLTDAEAEQLIYDNGRLPEKEKAPTAEEYDELTYKVHQLEKLVAKKDAEIREGDRDLKTMLDENDRLKAQIERLQNEALRPVPSADLVTDRARKMLQLSVKLVESVTSTMINEK